MKRGWFGGGWKNEELRSHNVLRNCLPQFRCGTPGRKTPWVPVSQWCQPHVAKVLRSPSRPPSVSSRDGGAADAAAEGTPGMDITAHRRPHSEKGVVSACAASGSTVSPACRRMARENSTGEILSDPGDVQPHGFPP